MKESLSISDGSSECFYQSHYASSHQKLHHSQHHLSPSIGHLTHHQLGNNHRPLHTIIQTSASMSTWKLRTRTLLALICLVQILTFSTIINFSKRSGNGDDDEITKGDATLQRGDRRWNAEISDLEERDLIRAWRRGELRNAPPEVLHKLMMIKKKRSLREVRGRRKVRVRDGRKGQRQMSHPSAKEVVEVDKGESEDGVGKIREEELIPPKELIQKTDRGNAEDISMQGSLGDVISEPVVIGGKKYYYQLLSVPDVCKQGSELMLLVVVVSRLSSRSQRDAIRQGWSSSHQGPGEEGEVLGHQTIFLVGQPTHYSNLLQEKLLEERKQHKDIVQVALPEASRGRDHAIEGAMALNYFGSHCPAARYYMKVEDTSLVNVAALIADLRSQYWQDTRNHYKIMCAAMRDKQASRVPGTAFYLPQSEWPDETLPEHCAAHAGYMMPRLVAQSIRDAAQELQPISHEEVYLTSMCAEKAKMHNFVARREEYLFTSAKCNKLERTSTSSGCVSCFVCKYK